MATQTRTNARVEHSAAIAAYAKAKGIDDSRAGKQFRAVLRANMDKIKTADPSFKHDKNAPWPSHSRKVLADLFPTVAAFKG